jgi:hypothetical protein
MIGDTNLFLQVNEENITAEVEVMIAETWAQGQHRGWETILLMLKYGMIYVPLTSEYISQYKI